MVTLRALREAHELTGDQLAERIAEQGVDVNTDHIYNVELGRKKASTRLKAAWARALRLQPVDVYQAEDLGAFLGASQAERKTA
jgi:DNA-binding XRE family transcriptional regulator